MEALVSNTGNRPGPRDRGASRTPPQAPRAGVTPRLCVGTAAFAAVALLGLAAAVTPARAADVDLSAGVLSYTDPGTVPNALVVSLAGGTYTIDDPAEAAIVLGGSALGQGCAPFDSNTVTCPAAAITSFSIATRLGIDTIVLTGVAHPAIVQGGDGNDTVVGGSANDTVVWNPGDDNDTIDGGGGDDTLLVNGGGASETFTITADGAGFDLARDVAAIRLEVENAETLQLNTAGGTDTVQTTGLLATAQVIVDGPAGVDDGLADVLTFDAAGLCPFQEGETFEVVGRQPVVFSGFPSALVSNAVCGAILDLSAGVLRYTGTPFAANALDVSLAGATYSLHDAGEPISPTPAATDQGCVPVSPDAVTCPAAAIDSFDIATRGGNDTIVLTGTARPALVSGGDGNDSFLGGNGEDVFVWNPGDDNDLVDGGPGADTLVFNGSNANEIFAITADGAGFDLSRNIANIQMEVDNAEVLVLTTLGGDDEVSTTSLLNTTQLLTAGPDPVPDTLRVDAAGLCLTRQNDTFAAAGRAPIQFANFAEILVSNAFCRDDPCADAVVTQGCRVNGVRDQPCQGTAGEDLIIGTKAGDVIRGGGGRDRIKAGSGDDLVCGEEGDDTLAGASGNDILAGGPGDDRLTDGSGADTLLGGDDDDDLKGGSDNDDLDGGAGDDRLRGGGDVDTLRGGPGVDRIDGGGDDDTCTDADQIGPFARCELP